MVGDLARSPRMVNHARELARSGHNVCLIGIREREFTAPAGVEVRALRPWRGIGSWGVAGAALRMQLILVQLLAELLRYRPDSVLVQNPPAFPTLAAARVAATLLRAELIVDWHNYGFTLLALRLGPRHWITRLAERHEVRGARRAHRHLCVSRAMSEDLAHRFGIRAEVLYDRPLQCFPPTDCGGRLTVLCPAGWTRDEDMALLLDALALLTRRDLEIHLTGDGPLRESLEQRIAALRNAGLAIRTGFLSQPDYWALIRRSGLGISMHRSSSGLDLAMKVVDLFSAAVPVCAFDYGGSLPEQVRDGETGFLFRTAAELAAILDRVQQTPALLAPMRDHIRAQCNVTWSQEWTRVAAF